MNRFKSRTIIGISIMLAACAMIVFSADLMAQRRGGRDRPDRGEMRERMEQRAEERFEKMCETLELDEQQQKKARVLFENAQEERRELFESFRGGDTDREEGREKMREINEKYLAEIEKLLNEEQKERFEEIKKEIQERRQNRPRR